MEDLKYRLKYNDINMRSRCLQKLFNAVKKKSKGDIINSSSVQVPELSLILEVCEDNSAVSSHLAVQLVVSLVMNKCMDTDYAINKLLGCMKSPSNYHSVLSGISTLLIHDYNSTEKTVSKYSLLFPKHPLIAALESNSNCLPFILECLAESLSLDYRKTLRVMEPVICYVLCDPTQKTDLNYFKVLFLETFISRLNDSSHVIQLALKYMPFMQVDSLHNTAEISYFVMKLIDTLAKLNDANCESSFLFKSVFLIAVSLVERSIKFGHDPSQLLMQLCSLSAKMNKSSLVNTCLVLIAYSLKYASGSLLDKISMLGIKLLENGAASPTVAAIVALSVIHVLPEPSITSCNDSVKTTLSKFLRKLESVYLKTDDVIDAQTLVEQESNTQTLAGQENNSQTLAEQENNTLIQDTSIEEEKTLNFLESFTPLAQKAATCMRFSNLLDKSSCDFKLKWLNSVTSFVNSSKKENFDIIYSLVSALFLMATEDEILLSSCLETLESILIKVPHLSTRAFPLLLYKMSYVRKPNSKFLLLNFLPKSAVHKYSIPPVLGVLKMMANETELKAQAIYLMLQLWKRQARCFPHLHALLNESNKPRTFDSGVDEVLIAQAASILEICSIEPDKHGQEFLNALSSIFNKCNDESSEPVACLAINGIITLCKSEVIDIRSTWKALAAKLTRDKRVMVTCRMYELLSLIPELQVKSYDYDKFMKETVAGIWKQICAGTSAPHVTAEAYKTLSKFPMDCHVLQQLPAAAKANLKLPASMKATPFEMSKLPEDVLTYIPGYCFVDLLISYENKSILEGYVSFLQSLIKLEVEELPRSAYSQTRHVTKQRKVNEALSKVPEYLCTHFHSRKSPALQKNLAVGVLFCYEPPIEIGKDGTPVKRSIATQSRSYEQVLTVLLNEVNIDATEWHRCILISSAWGSFMERALFACEEGRRAELELQRAHGHLDVSLEELNEQCKSAWLWVRDRFLGIVKANIKNTSTAHANAVFAVSGLVYALDKFYSSLDESSKALAEENEKYLSHRHFIAEYVETVLCAVYPEYQPTGKVQSWLLTHLSRPNSSLAYLVTGCACASLCHLTPVLASHYANDIPELFNIMQQNLGHSSPVLSFYSGIGIGLFVKSLCEFGYPDTGENQVNLLLNVVKEVMQMYEDSENTLTSSLIGLTFSIASLSHVVDDNIKDWVLTTCNVFYEKLMDEEKSSMQFEMMCICVTAMIISAAEGSCVPMQSVEDLASWIEMNRLELPQCSGISVSMGMLIEGFERFGHSDGAEMKQKVLKGWFNTVTSERRPTLQKIAALNGLCSLFSHGRGFIQVKSQPSAESISTLNDLLQVMFQILNASRDTGLQSICSWEVGRLFAVNSNQQQVESSVSTSYTYLGEKSILKSVMGIVLSYQKEDETAFKYCHVLACLKSLASPFPRPLPPINWVTVLTPFLQQQNEDPEVIETAIKIAVYQCSGSSYALNVVSSYSSPPLIHTLPQSSFKVLLDNIPGLCLALPSAKLQVYLQTVITQTIKKDDMMKTFGEITLQGIVNSLKQTGYKEQSKKVLQDAFICVLRYFKSKENYVSKYLPWIVESLLLLPQDLQISQIQVPQNVDELDFLTMVWCYLIKTGEKPLSSLRPCIEEAKCCPLEQKEKSYTHIYDCFLYGSQNEKSEISQPNQCISWLLETIGWIRVLEDTKSKYQLLTASEVYTFLVDVCLATIVGCSGLENSYFFLPDKTIDHHSLLKSLPQSISTLSQRNQWTTAMDKIIDWLMMLIKSPYIKEDEKYFIKLSLCSLRNTNQFQKKEIWTDVICNIIIE